MTSLRTWALGTLLAAVSTAAVAFQEQQSGGGAGAPAPSSAAGSAVEPSSGLVTAPTMPGKPVGTEIRIPGLGSLGMLPKMDFGLELLYGAAETKAADEQRNAIPGSDDLTIKGTLRRKF